MKKWIVSKWLQLARHFPIVRRIPVIGGGKPDEDPDCIDSAGAA